MGLFGKKNDDFDEPVGAVEHPATVLARQVAELSGQVEALTAHRDGLRSIDAVQAELARVRQALSDKQIELDRVNEKNAREAREVEHKVGLMREKVEQDTEHVKRMTALEVREGNLATERDRFEKEMAFQRDHFDKALGDTKDILTKVLDRLPNVTANYGTPPAS